MIIDIKFPKLPKDYSYWLSRPTNQEEKVDNSYGPYRKVSYNFFSAFSKKFINQLLMKGTDSYKACDVQTWLGCIQSETAPEPMDDGSESSAELVTLSDTTSVNSKDSESIEVVSTNVCLKFNSEVIISQIITVH